MAIYFEILALFLKKEGRRIYCKIMQHQPEACVTQLI